MPDSRPVIPASISAQLTVFFDGRFWIGVLEHHELRRGGDTIGRAITVRAARHVFGAEPSDVELYDFLLAHGGALIDRAAASPPIPTSGSAGSAGSSSAPRPNPSAPPDGPPRRPPGRARPPRRRPPCPLPARRPPPVQPTTGVGAAARRRTRPGPAIGRGPSAAIAADDTTPVFRKSRRRG